MRWFVVGALLGGCFDPRPQPGIACDPVNPQCPDGQACLSQGSGHVCGGDGSTGDAGTDGGTDGPVDPFAYVQTVPGYTVSVFQDFSGPFTFDANDWPEMTEVHDNQPRYVFTLDAPYPQAIGVIAGREILVLDGAGIETHDFGLHVRNTPGQADNLTGAILAKLSPSDTAPTLLVSSSSEDTGDGAFAITPAWTISTDLVVNNTRCLLSDPAGAFDGGNVPERYLGAQQGIVRRSDGLAIITGDTRSMRLVDEDLYVTRATALVDRLIRIQTVTHTEVILAERARLRIVEGEPPPSAIAWAIVDDKQLVIARPDGTLDVVAELLDAGYLWTSAVVPPADHPLAGRIYVLESHRGSDVDRVLAIEPP